MNKFEQLLTDLVEEGRLDPAAAHEIADTGPEMRQEIAEAKAETERLNKLTSKMRTDTLARKLRERGVTFHLDILRVPDELDALDDAAVDGWLADIGLAPR